MFIDLNYFSTHTHNHDYIELEEGSCCEIPWDQVLRNEKAKRESKFLDLSLLDEDLFDGNTIENDTPFDDEEIPFDEEISFDDF